MGRDAKNWLICAYCAKPIEPEDESLLADVPFHSACCDAYLEDFSAALSTKSDEDLDIF